MNECGVSARKILLFQIKNKLFFFKYPINERSERIVGGFVGAVESVAVVKLELLLPIESDLFGCD